MKKFLLIFLFPLSVYSQTVIGDFTFIEIPQDKQLYARNGSDIGTVLIVGEYDKSGPSPDYDRVQVKVKQDRAKYGSNHIFILEYNGGDVASFNFSIEIDAVLSDYTFEINARDGNYEDVVTVNEVVAGDVYVIQGQSNAEARKRSGSANTDPLHQFIRVYAYGNDDTALLEANDAWYIGQGDGGRGSNGNTGQWGYKLARMLIDSKSVPIAIFNGARGAKSIAYFQENYVEPGDASNNFNRLLYRLEKTKLKGDVKAILWSQGENLGGIDEVNDYKNAFLELRKSWLDDLDHYPNVEKIYIFQTINGCDTDYPEKQYIKEDQRQLAEEYVDIHIMPTDGLENFSDNCHFVYQNGYEGFAERIFNLVKRDFYNGTSINVEAPKILSATLIDDTTLEIQTDASNLYIDNNPADTFKLEDSNGESITGISVSGSKITFTLSGYPGTNASISNLGADPGESDGLVRDSANQIEILSFYKYPITISIPNTSIMITQYYEGLTSSDRWIEIKNISGSVIPANRYYLARYDSGSDLNDVQSDFAPIPEIGADGANSTIVFQNSGAQLPLGAYTGDGPVYADNVCNFSGNDLLLISTENGTDCYNNRQDIIGKLTNWGKDKSFVRGDDALPDKEFNIDNWIELSLEEVNNADPNSNIALRTQDIGAPIWNGSSWSNLVVPDRTRNVLITNDYDANDGTIITKNLIVSANMNFNNNTTNSVVVYGDLTINGTFVIGDKESLVMYNKDANITGSLTKLENSTERNGIRDFTYWSSSVIALDAQIASVFDGVLPSRIFYYDQSQSQDTAPDPEDPTNTYWNVWQPALGSMNMTAGVGYAAEGDSDDVHRISFVGKPNNGNITIPIVYHDDGEIDNDFNLIGNPYPSAIHLDSLFSTNTNVDVAYFWTHDTGISEGTTGDFVSNDYTSINKIGGTKASTSGTIAETNIGSGQGFFVHVINYGSVTFTNDMRIKEANNQFFKSSISKKSVALKAENEKDRIWLNLTTDQGGFSQILLGYRKKLTNKVDIGYDALTFSGSNNPISFYSVIQKEKYVIQGQRTFINSRKATLGFDTSVAPRTFTISIDRTEGALKDVDVYLVDNQLKLTHKLSESNYVFQQLTSGDFPKRFTLKYVKDSDIDNSVSQENRNSFIVSNDGSGMTVSSNNVVNKFRIFNLYGRKYIAIRPKRNYFTVNTDKIKSGTILILEATFKNGEVITKKTINH